MRTGIADWFAKVIVEPATGVTISSLMLDRHRRISVWRQGLVEDASTVTVGGRSYPVRRTSRLKLRQVDFEFESHHLRGLEQNPSTGSRWAQLAREGKKVMQFLDAGRYIANVVDGKAQFYGHVRL
jgi:NADPH-dependent ferric siderophore reductase